MRNMSFSLTVEQVRQQRKTVTRRRGWRFLYKGDLVRAVVKGQGLRRGEHVVPICVIEIVDVRVERLDRMLTDPLYGAGEVRLEGFGDHPRLGLPAQFVEFFARTHQCEPTSRVTRIEFRYPDLGRLK